MKIISNVELSLSYEHWKQKMLENEKFRLENEIFLLAYGHEKDNEKKVWVVMEVPSLEHMARIINKPEMVKLREEAGAIIETQQMIPLVE